MTIRNSKIVALGLFLGLVACGDNAFSPEMANESSINENSSEDSTTENPGNNENQLSNNGSSSSTLIDKNPGTANITETITNEVYETVSNGKDPVITYTATGASVSDNNGCVYIKGGEVVISCAGDYDFSGSYSGEDGQIRVYSPKADTGVYLNLRGLTLNNTSDAPIYVQMASKTFVVAKSGTTNTLSDGKNRSKEFSYQNSKGVTKTDTTKATIYSKDDLTIKGEGSLTVNGNFNNGIQSSNDLRFRGETTVNINAANNGLKGKGSVNIEKGSITIKSAGDGIKSDEGEDEGSITEGKGIVVINGGSIDITASDDGIKAYNYILIADTISKPSISIIAGSGTPDLTKSNGGMGGGPGNRPGSNNQWSSGTCYGPNCNTSNSSSSTSSSEESSKGLVAGVNILILAGDVTVAAHKDAIHSNGTAFVKGGTLSLTGRNGIHADTEITVSDSAVIDVPNSYEGFESTKITMKGGITSVYASDDGWNGSDGSGSDNCSSCMISIAGGFHYVRVPSGDTDGIDSNGKISVTGGYVAVENMSSNGGTANVFDAGSGGSITGGNVLGWAPSSEINFSSYSVSFSANKYYGTSKWACMTHASGNKIWSNNGQPGQISNFNGMTAVSFTGTTASCYYAK